MSADRDAPATRKQHSTSADCTSNVFQGTFFKIAQVSAGHIGIRAGVGDVAGDAQNLDRRAAFEPFGGCHFWRRLRRDVDVVTGWGVFPIEY